MHVVFEPQSEEVVQLLGEVEHPLAMAGPMNTAKIVPRRSFIYVS
jgi:hypothetical protein